MKTSVQMLLVLATVIVVIYTASLLNLDNSTAWSSPNDLSPMRQDAPVIKASIGGYTLYLPFVKQPPKPILLPLVMKAVSLTPTATPTATPSTIPNPVKNGGFEQPNDGANGPWYASYTYIGQTVQGWDVRHTLAGTGASPHSGSYAAWLGGLGTSGYQMDVLQQITVPVSGTTLRYWIWIQSDEPNCSVDYDNAWVFFISSQQNQVDSFYLCNSTRTNGWVKREISLSNYVGQTGWLAFSVRILGFNSNLFLDDVAMGTLPNASSFGQTPTPISLGTPTP